MFSVVWAPGPYEDPEPYEDKGPYEDLGSYEDPRSYEDPGSYDDSEFFDDPGKTQELFDSVCLIWWNLQRKVDLYYVYTRANYYGFKINLDLL